VVAECTNISVGYYNQHSVAETQDLEFAELLLQHLLEADWSKIVISRDPASYEDSWGYYEKPMYEYGNREALDMVSVVEDNPAAIASLLESLGYTYQALLDDIDSGDSYYTNNYASRRMM